MKENIAPNSFNISPLSPKDKTTGKRTDKGGEEMNATDPNKT